MTRRALVAVLAALTFVPAPPAPAAASQYVVYEAYPIKPNGPKKIPIRMYSGMLAEPGMFAQVTLQPSGDGYDHTRFSFMVGESVNGGLWTFDYERGQRYLFAAPRAAKMRFLSLSGYWRVRTTTIGFRTVTANQVDRDVNVAGTGMEQFHSASAPAGRYGSLVFASIPCGNGVGTWTLSIDATKVDGGTCLLGWGGIVAESDAGKKWNLEGPVLGKEESFYRLVVMDYPKR